MIIQCEGATGQSIQYLIMCYLMPNDNFKGVPISSSTEENTEFEVPEFEVPKSFVSCLGSNRAYIFKYRITKVTLFKHAM